MHDARGGDRLQARQPYPELHRCGEEPRGRLVVLHECALGDAGLAGQRASDAAGEVCACPRHGQGRRASAVLRLHDLIAAELDAVRQGRDLLVRELQTRDCTRGRRVTAWPSCGKIHPHAGKGWGERLQRQRTLRQERQNGDACVAADDGHVDGRGVHAGSIRDELVGAAHIQRRDTKQLPLVVHTRGLEDLSAHRRGRRVGSGHTTSRTEQS